MFGLSLTGICIFVWNSIPIHIMYFMSISVKHLLPNVCYKFYQANDKKKLNLIQACLWRLLHEEISDLDHFIINQIACSPFETRKLRWLIWGRSNVIEILMSFLYLGMSNFGQLRCYFFSRQTEFDKHHTYVYTEQLRPNGPSHLYKKKNSLSSSSRRPLNTMNSGTQHLLC